MTIGSVPPRPNLPQILPGEAKPAETQKAAEPAKKTEKDELQKAPALPKGPGAGPAPALQPPPGGAGPELAAHMEAFTLLSGQVGDIPEGARAASAFEANLSSLETRPGVASLGFSRQQIAATNDLLALVREGALEVPRELEAALADKLAVMTAPLPQAALEAQLKKLPQNEQEAFSKLAAALAPAFAALSKKASPKARARLQTLRGKKGLKLSAIPSREDLEAIEPEELRDLIRRALGRHSQGSDEEVEEEEAAAPAETPAKKKPLNANEREALLEAELAAIVSLEKLVLPDLDLVALERAFATALPSFKGLDPETLADMLLVQCGAESEQALGAMLDEAKALDVAERPMRKKLKVHERVHDEAKAELKKRYDDRVRLTPDHPSALDKSVRFDAYCQEQALWLAAGSLKDPETPKIVLRLSPKEAFRGQPTPPGLTEVALADVRAVADDLRAVLLAQQETRDALSSRLEFYLERRAGFQQMIRAMIAHAGKA